MQSQKDVIERKLIKNNNTLSKIISNDIKEQVWNKHIGKYVGRAKCHMCRRQEITTKNYKCGYLISIKNGGMVNINWLQDRVIEFILEFPKVAR